MRKFLIATALVAVAACAGKTDAGTKDSVPPAGTAMTPDSSMKMSPDSSMKMSPDSSVKVKPDTGH